MSDGEPELMLAEFKESGDTKSLLAFVEQSGRNLEAFKKVVHGLGAVFDSLSFGEYPNVDEIDVGLLAQNAAAVESVVKWMAESKKADMKSAALDLMGRLGWESFKPDMVRSLSSENEWERTTARNALKRIKSQWATELMRTT